MSIAMIGATLLASHAVVADEPPILRHNPFARPPSNVVLPSVAAGRTLDPSAAPVLLATMVAGQNRLANVDGRTLRRGDEIHGYTLVQILEDRAVFERQGIRTTVLVKPQLEEKPLDSGLNDSDE